MGHPPFLAIILLNWQIIWFVQFFKLKCQIEIYNYVQSFDFHYRMSFHFVHSIVGFHFLQYTHINVSSSLCLPCCFFSSSFFLTCWFHWFLALQLNLNFFLCWPFFKFLKILGFEMEKDGYQQVSGPKYECLLFGESSSIILSLQQMLGMLF